MSSELPRNSENRDIVHTLALFLSGKIRKEDMSENNQVVMGYYLGLMADDPGFAKRVNAIKIQMLEKGKKVPLYTSEELQKAKSHRKHREVRGEMFFQPGFWEGGSPQEEIKPELVGFQDPEKKLAELHRFSSRRFNQDYRKILSKEVGDRKNELRNVIGLPIARGKNPYVNDDFYKFLVRRVCTFDTFKIFNEYDRAISEIPPDLDAKIGQVKGLVDELLNQGLGRRERFERFNQFTEEYEKEWSMKAKESDIFTSS